MSGSYPIRGLLTVPRLRHVLDSRLALVIDQNERQRVCIRPAKFIHTRASAGFGNSPRPARLLNSDCITCHGIVAPDLCFWLRSCDVKCTVRVDCPDSTKRVGPCAGERGSRQHQTSWSMCRRARPDRMESSRKRSSAQSTRLQK